MKDPTWLFRTLLLRVALKRSPDVVIGPAGDVYLNRWWLTPFRGWHEKYKNHPSAWVRVIEKVTALLPNVYLHEFLRSDDDRALHDHPWLFNASLILDGEYIEHTIAAGGSQRRVVRSAGTIKVRFGGAPHRVELIERRPCWTLFITGPVIREWGFHCPNGWVHWRDFTANNGATVGKGCDL